MIDWKRIPKIDAHIHLLLEDVIRLVFATDYPDSRCLKPNEIYDKYFEILGEMDFTQEEAKNICKNNALRMLGVM